MSGKSPSRFLEYSLVAQDADNDEFLRDAPLEYDGGLDHAPATSHGTYLDGINDDLEPLEDYQDGGYHPIHLGDTLGISSRYRVIQKLGYGGFGTVWLCRDTQDASYVAVKVMVGGVRPEALPDLALARLDRSAPGAECIAIPLDSFSIQGPNGSHQCIVLPVLGPCVSPNLWLRMKKDPGPILRGMAHQAAGAMRFLHKNGLCHGDFRPSNILVKLTNLDKLSEDELLSLLGQPEKVQVRTESGQDLPTFSPQYLVHNVDMSRLGDQYLTDGICVIDFGESFSISSPPADLGIPENYLPPEVLLSEEDEEGEEGEKEGHEESEKKNEKNPISPACDLWALGCTLFEIRQQIPLFYMIFDRDELLAEMVRFFGKLPEEWWEKWGAREDFFDDQGTCLRDEDVKEEWTLELALSKSLEVIRPARRALIISEVEQKLLTDLLYKLFSYGPDKRLSAEEALAHDWFRM